MLDINYVKYTKKIKKLIGEVEETGGKLILNEEKERYEKILNQFNSDLKEIDKKNKFKVALVGQYSAGKSTIITALTNNRDIKIGQNITTDITNEYEWNNLLLVDTPGIGTGNLKHDEITYKQMDLADLLIYIITVQGFDSLIAKDFKNIAFDRQKYSKMMLVVNKSSMESFDNKKQWENDIEKVIKPFSLEEFNTTFIDARDYLDSLDELDLEDKAELVEMSNYTDLVDKINKFVEEKKINGRLISTLNVIDECVLNLLNELTIDTGSKKIKELLQQKKFLVFESKRGLEEKVDNEIDNLNMEIKSLSNEIIIKIDSELNPEEFKIEIEEVIEKINNLCEKTIKNICEKIECELDILIKKINNLENSDLYKDILNSTDVELDFEIDLKQRKEFNRVKKIDGVLGEVSKFLGVSGKGFKSWCTNADSLAKGLKAFSGSDAHKFVLGLGHLLGKKFKPYEALKIVGKINKAGGVIAKIGKGAGIAGAVLGPVMAAYEEYQESEFENNIKNARIEMRKNFKVFNDEINKNLKDKKEEIMTNIYETEIENINLQIEKLRDEEKIKSKEAEVMKGIKNKIKDTIKEIACS